MNPTDRLTFAVVVLNWNGRPYLEACLSALAAQTYPVTRVLLVDNGSSDDSIAFVRARFPSIEVIDNSGNVGFGAGNNVALRQLLADERAADIALLLNPDVVLSPGYVAALAETLAADPTIAIAGGKLWYPDEVTLQHAGGYITTPQAMPGHHGVGQRDTGQEDAQRDVAYVIGAALAVRLSALARVGLFDEGFFLFYEDTDLCIRAQAAGYRVVYEPRATAVHVESAVAVRGSFAYLQRFHSGRWRYLLKHFSTAQLLDETLPAETAWLERIDAAERRAASLAYLATRHALPDIRHARGAADPLPDEAWAALATALDDLRARARQDALDSAALAGLAEAATLVERPFVSTVPLFGPLIARFRTAWNNVASRWYVGYVMEQQNAFNALAVRQLETYELELREQLALLEEQVVEQEELRRRVQELAAQVAALGRGAEDKETTDYTDFTD
jgi:GT2 family glycosyltransferase